MQPNLGEEQYQNTVDNSTININTSAATLGVFDGLHKGHINIFNTLKSLPYKRKIALVVHPHPRKILENVDVEYITPLEIRTSMIKSFGFDTVKVLEFTKEFSQIPGTEFVRNVLIKQFGCEHLVVGFNAHFGKSRDATPESLPKIASITNINLTICASVMHKNESISSTRIRKAIKEGNLYEVSSMLDRNFFIEGMVVKSSGLGRKIGFPTINVDYYPEQILPPIGVYYGCVNLTEGNLPAMINLGFKPTVKFNLQKPCLEVHIVGREIDNTPPQIRVEFIEKIRDEKKFASLEELKQQLEIDKKYVLKKINNE